jgi:hypothetical protein
MADYRILVTGSRGWQDFARVSFELGIAIGESGHCTEDIVVVHGGCPTGADSMAAAICRDYRWRAEEHRASWRPDGVLDRSAGFRRNAEMVSLGANVCLAFIRNGSRGASHCADLAEKAGIPVRRIMDTAPGPGREHREGD